jgi:protein-serine/threonine kinase
MLTSSQQSPAIPEMSDLLPPSPTTANAPHRFFPTPSPLGGPLPPHQSQPPSATIPFHALPPSAPMQPTLSHFSIAMQPTLSSYSNTTQTALGTPQLQSLGLPELQPDLRPLDLGGMVDEEVFAELERTVVDMQAWLSCVEGGLEDLLRPMEGAGIAREGT